MKMIVFSHLLYFVLLFWENNAILQIKDSLKKKNLRFLENLKNDLRRNNDDYADIARNVNDTQVFNNKQTGQAQEFSARRVNEKIDVRDKLIDKIRRRVNDALLSKESEEIGRSENKPQRRAIITADRSAVSKNLIIAPVNHITTMKSFWKNLNKMKSKNFKAIPEQIISYSNKSIEFNRTALSMYDLQSETLKSTTATIKIKPLNDVQKQIKKTKMEKFKKFIKRNKGLLKEFISSKMESQTPMTLTTRRTDLRASKRISESELRKAMQDAVSGLRNNNLGNMPNAALLDMAPAKGGRIHQKRLRGRLCHRHVLVPEGPKYDSAGRAYLPPHAARRAHEYNATRAPRLLLPRCCNCCRKSVLGCE